MTELELIETVLEDCAKCPTKGRCRLFVKNAMKFAKDNMDSFGESDFVRVGFECGMWKYISIELIKEITT